jgi:hypothetical protein
MFKDYINAVVKEYNDKVSANTISLNLTPLTPGNVKKECVAICRGRFRTMDERVLSAFFGYAENVKGYLQAIDRCDIDKFRPMINFVEGRSKDTDSKNIELLAWLVDFQERPFDPDGKYGGLRQTAEVEGLRNLVIEENHNLKSNLKSPLPETSLQPLRASGERQIVVTKKSWSKNKILIIAIIVALFVGTVGYLSINNPMSRSKISNNDSCMYWKDDHYEKISCGQKVQYSKVIAADPEILNSFRRITIPDTITYNSIGKVWYIKIKGEPEFYTGMGYHPVLMQLQLKPITKYIIDTHIRKKALLNDSVPGLLPTANIADGIKQLKILSPGMYEQCRAITKTKIRCSRNAKRGGLCWQHKKQGA